MASSLIRLRRTLRALSGVTQSISATHAPSFSTPIRSSQNNIPDEIGPDTILFEGCDYNHWLFVMDFPRDNKPPPEEMVRVYEETCAKGLNISVEEAKKKIYACSTTTYTGFQAVMTEEESKKFEGLPGVIFVLPDSYIDPVNKQYGGDQYINGTIIPRPPPVQYGRNQGRRDRNRSPGQYNRQENPVPSSLGNPSYSAQESMPRDGRNYAPPQNYPPPQNYGQASQQYSPRQNSGQASQNYPPQQNFGQASQNYPPQQNFGQASQNYPPQQNFGQASQNYPPQQNFGQASQNYPPQQNFGQASQNYPPQQNFGQASQSYPPQQSYGQASQNYSPEQKYGQTSQNYPSQQNYGQASQNYPPQQKYGQTSQNYPPQQNHGQASPNSPPQQNYGLASQNYRPQQTFDQAPQNYPQYAQQQGFGPPGGQGERSYMPQQNIGRPGQGERRDPVPRHGTSDVRGDTFVPSYMTTDFKPAYMEEFEQAKRGTQPAKELSGSQLPPSGPDNFTGQGRY